MNWPTMTDTEVKLFKAKERITELELSNEMYRESQGDFSKLSKQLAEAQRENAELKQRMQTLLALTAYEQTKDCAPGAWAEITTWFNEDGSAK